MRNYYLLILICFSASFNLNAQSDTLSITSISPSNIVAGTLSNRSKVTIIGTGFGNSRGTIYYNNGISNPPPEIFYISWTDNQIEFYMPNFARSGKLIIENVAGDTISQEVTIDYDLNSGIVKYYDVNGTGNWVFNVDSEIYQNEAMMDALQSAYLTWRCITGVNFTFREVPNNLNRNNNTYEIFVSVQELEQEGVMQ